MNVGFTGTKHGMRPKQFMSLSDVLSRFEPEDFHHGDCRGADEQAAGLAFELGYYIICHPPIKDKSRAYFKYNDEIRKTYDYIIRDHHIVDESNILIATPHTSYEVIHSGTWATVRYARSLHKDIYIINSDGSVIKE